jgi:hypothetical protein
VKSIAFYSFCCRLIGIVIAFYSYRSGRIGNVITFYSYRSENMTKAITCEPLRFKVTLLICANSIAKGNKVTGAI